MWQSVIERRLSFFISFHDPVRIPPNLTSDRRLREKPTRSRNNVSDPELPCFVGANSSTGNKSRQSRDFTAVFFQILKKGKVEDRMALCWYKKRQTERRKGLLGDKYVYHSLPFAANVWIKQLLSAEK